MSANIIIKKKFIVEGQPDGFSDADIVRTRLFRQTATFEGTLNEGDTFTSSDYLAAAKIPEGFVPEGIVVNVRKANASSSTLTVYAAKTATDIGDESSNNYDSGDLVSLGTAALASAGKTYAEILPSIAVASTVGTPTSGKWIAGKDDYLVLKASADVDAEFEVALLGTWVTFP
jgi:hypothetical protein